MLGRASMKRDCSKPCRPAILVRQDKIVLPAIESTVSANVAHQPLRMLAVRGSFGAAVLAAAYAQLFGLSKVIDERNICLAMRH